MKNILIAALLTLSIGTVQANEICTPIDNVIKLGQTAETCATILSVLTKDQVKYWIQTNKYCMNYNSTKMDVIVGLTMMHSEILKYCLSQKPKYNSQLQHVKKQLDMVNKFL